MSPMTTRRRALLAACCALALAAALALAGCASASMPSKTPAAKSGGMGAMSSGSMSGAEIKTASDIQTCSQCGGKGMAPMVQGTVADENGVQVVNVSIKGGYYTPNTFTVKAGTPVKVVFTGKAKGCLAKPSFKTLGKGGDYTKTGTLTLDLGALAPGTYQWKCGMGMTGGTIRAQ